MSFSSPISSDLSTNGLPPINQANEPASDPRNGDADAKKAYQTGLSFEQMLVTQLTQELASTATDSSSDGSGDQQRRQQRRKRPDWRRRGRAARTRNMLPQTLTSSIMAGGGTGIALQIANARLDPALAYPTAAQVPRIANHDR